MYKKNTIVMLKNTIGCRSHIIPQGTVVKIVSADTFLHCYDIHPLDDETRYITDIPEQELIGDVVLEQKEPVL